MAMQIQSGQAAGHRVQAQREVVLPSDVLSRVLAMSASDTDLINASHVSHAFREVAKRPDLIAAFLPGVARELVTWQGLCHRVATRAGLRSGRCNVTRLPGLDAQVTALGWDARGTRLAAGTTHGVVAVWDLEAFGTPPVTTAAADGKVVSDLTFNEPATHLLITLDFSDVCLWSVAGDQEPSVFENSRAVFHPSGHSFVRLSRSGRLTLHSTRYPFSPSIDLGLPPTVSGLCFDSAGEQLALGGGRGDTFVCNLVTGAEPARLSRHAHLPDAIDVAFSATGRHCKTQTWGWEGGSALVWDLEDSAAAMPLSIGATRMVAAAFDGKGVSAVTAYENGSVAHWSLADAAAPLAVIDTDLYRICSLEADFAGAHALACTANADPGPEAKLFRLAAKQMIHVSPAEPGQGTCYAANFDSRGNSIFICEDHANSLWTSHHRIIRSVARPDEFIDLASLPHFDTRHAVFDPTGSRVAVSGADGAVGYYDFNLSRGNSAWHTPATASRSLNTGTYQPSASDRVSIAFAIPLHFGIMATCFSAMAVWSPLLWLLGKPVSTVGAAAGATACAGLASVPMPWIVSGLVAPRFTWERSWEITQHCRKWAMVA